jgi:hypothetical protein
MRPTMKRAAVRSIAVALMLLAMAVKAEAQQAKKLARIGLLSAVSLSTIPDFYCNEGEVRLSTEPPKNAQEPLW